MLVAHPRGAARGETSAERHLEPIARSPTLDLSGAAGERATPQDVERLKQAAGLYHATAAGETTWFGFAQAIFAARAHALGAAFKAPRLVAIATSEYPTPARRPANSVLSNAKLNATLGVAIGDWRAGLAEALSELGGP